MNTVLPYLMKKQNNRPLIIPLTFYSHVKLKDMFRQKKAHLKKAGCSMGW